MSLILLICAVWAFDHSSVLIIHSSKTSSELLELFNGFPNQFDIDAKRNPDLSKEVAVMVDITEDTFYLTFLDFLANELKINYLTISRVPENFLSKTVFPIFLHYKKEAKIIQSTIQALNWSHFGIFSSSALDSIQLMNEIKSISSSSVSTCVISETSDSERFIKIAKRLIKAAGLKNVIIIGYGDFLTNFQQALKNLKLDQKNVNFLFPTLTAGQVVLENSIILTQEFLTDSNSFYSMIYETILKILDKKSFQSRFDLKKECWDNSCLQEIQIIRIQNSVKTIAGFFNGSVVFYNLNAMNPLEFEFKSKISLFIANGSNELNSSISNPTYSEWYKGALYGIEYANLNQELKNFEFVTKGTNCGNVAYDPDWYFSCLSSAFKSIPVAYLTSNAAYGAFGNLVTLKKMGLFIPQVAGYGILQGLENKTLFPEFLTLSFSIIDFALSGPSLIAKNFKWKDLIIFATDDFLSIVNSIIEILHLFELNIINPLHLRFLPANYSRADYSKYKEYFDFAKASRCRFFIMYCQDTGPILEALYDSGLRKGDFMTFWDPYYIEKMMGESNKYYLNKRLELIQGNLIMGYKEWEGDLGIKLKQELESKYNNINFMCLTYDAFLLIKNTIIYLVNIGEDFEDPYLLMESMRRQRMVGCMGGIFFSQNYNTRKTGKILLRQAVLSESEINIEVIDFLIIDRYSASTIVYLNPGNWVGDSTPSNYIQLNECGFDERNIRESVKGKTMKKIFSGLLIFFTLFFSFVSWKVFNSRLSEFKEGELINTGDIYFFSFFMFEFFQFLTLEPKNAIISKVLTRFNYLLGFELLSYFHIKEDKYWDFYWNLLLLTFSASAFVLLDYAKLLKSLEKINFLKSFIEISRVFSCFLGQIGYFPVIYMLLSIYECENAAGDSLTLSYLEKDCKTFCYKEKHLKYLISGTIDLYLFSSVFAFLRPFWELHLDAHVKTKVFYLLFLCNVQVLLIVTRTLSRSFDSIVSDFIICGLLAGSFIFTLIYQPYNYKRATILQIMTLFLSFWCIFISNLFVIFGDFWYFYFMLVFGCFAVIFVATCISNKYPKGFKKEVEIPISNYIKYQFYSNYDILKRQSLYYEQANESSLSIKT